MNDDERKPKIHIHTGGLIILIIILIVLFKVDILSTVKSPQFQKNITYITEKTKDIWENGIMEPFKTRLFDPIVNAGNDNIEKLQNGIKNNVIKVTSEEDVQKILD